MRTNINYFPLEYGIPDTRATAQRKPHMTTKKKKQISHVDFSSILHDDPWWSHPIEPISIQELNPNRMSNKNGNGFYLLRFSSAQSILLSVFFSFYLISVSYHEYLDPIWFSSHIVKLRQFLHIPCNGNYLLLSSISKNEIKTPF